MRIIANGLIILILAACATQSARTPVRAGYDNSALDRSVSACDNFYQFANGGWMKRTPIPAGYSRWGAFYILDESNQQKLHTVVEEAARANAATGTDQQRVGQFYRSCMDEGAIKRAALEPIRADLDRINALRSTSDLPQMLARLHSYAVPVVFGFASTQDYKNTEQVVASIGQGGLGLPDRDYYTKDDTKSKEIRDRYVQHVARMLQLLGDPPEGATKGARDVMNLETALARASMTNVELRDPVATYNKMTTAELQALSPSFSWREYLSAAGAPSVQSLVVGQPKFVSEIQNVVASQPIEAWRNYLRWHLVNATASQLPKKFDEADFDFNSRYLQGTNEMLPRWKRCVSATDASLGQALGRLWSERYFPESAKTQALDMIHNLERALDDNLKVLAWMSPATREQAKAKLDAFGLKIGYPDKWRDYSPLTIGDQPYASNALAASQFEFRRDAAKIDRPVDRTEWLMTPPTVNAYNNPPMNEIVFPAGILQPPFYDPATDEAYNYGGMGAVIGHEIIHGFDDQGRQFDLRGNLAEWWTAEDKARFLERAKCVSDQFSGYDVGGGLHMTGDLVLGESIADLGGLELAFAAYKKSQEGKPRQTIDGFTPEQRFFLGWARVWSEKAKPEAERLQITTDPHPRARFRVNGPLSNMPEFAEAFGCNASTAMVRPADRRCDVW